MFLQTQNAQTVDKQTVSSVKVKTELGIVKSFQGEILKRLFNISTAQGV
jgi:hypothetical protein